MEFVCVSHTQEFVCVSLVLGWLMRDCFALEETVGASLLHAHLCTRIHTYLHVHTCMHVFDERVYEYVHTFT